MFGPLIEALERFVTDFSFRRVLTWGSFFSLVVLGLIAYEAYSGRIRLQRLSDEVTLLERMEALGGRAGIASDRELGRTFTLLKTKLQSEVAGTDGRNLVLSRVWLQALAALLPWTLMALMFALIPGMRSESSELWQLLTGMLIFAIPFAALAMAQPLEWPWWIRYIGYPFAGTLVISVGITKWSNRKSAAS